MRFALACLLLLNSVAAAQDAQDRLNEAKRVRDQGVAAFKKSEFAEAGDLYDKAIALYEDFHGKDSIDAANQNVVLRRAVLWCRTQSGQLDALPTLYAPFFDTVVRIGGAPDEEASARQSAGEAMARLAVKGDEKGVEGIAKAWGSAMDGASEALKKDKSNKEASDAFSKRCESARAHFRHDHMEALYILGKRADGEKEYRAVVKFWEDRGDGLQAAWTPQNAFFEMTRRGKPADAAFFAVETLARAPAKRFGKPLSYFAVNLRAYLTAVEKDGRPADGIAFLEAALAVKTQDLPPGFDAIVLRTWLARFLADNPDKAAANGDALADAAKKAGDRWSESRGARAAAEALLASKPDESLKRATRAAEAAAGDRFGEGYARIDEARALTALKKFEESEAAVAKALTALAEYNPGMIEARKAGLANAKAAGNQKNENKYAADLRGASANGGRGGEAIGEMEPAALVARMGKQDAEFDILEVTRKGNKLTFKNLLDGASAETDADQPFHHLNVSGVLFQVRGAELSLVNIYDQRTAPGVDGESAMTVGGVATCTGPDFDPFALRAFVAEGRVLRVTSGLRIYLAGK